MLWGGWEWIVGGSVATLVRPPRFFPLPFLSVFSVLPLRIPWRGFFLAVLWDMEEEVLVGSGARPRVPQYPVGRVCINAFPPPPDPVPIFSPSPGSVHCAACVPIMRCRVCPSSQWRFNPWPECSMVVRSWHGDCVCATMSGWYDDCACATLCGKGNLVVSYRCGLGISGSLCCTCRAAQSPSYHSFYRVTSCVGGYRANEIPDTPLSARGAAVRDCL